MVDAYTSVDIGSDTIKVVVCQLNNNKLNLLAASSVKSKGIKNGLIINEEQAKESIKKAVSAAEDMLGLKITKVITSISSYNASFNLVTSKTSITKDTGVDENDISRALENLVRTIDLNGKELINIIPVDFEIDGIKGIINPRGHKGKVLNSRAVLVTAPKKNVYSVVTLFEELGLEVVDISINGVGDINALKNKNINGDIGAIINIGYNITNISIYNKGIIIKNSIIDLGSKNIDNDISYIYKLNEKDSINIKEKYALAHKKYASKIDYYNAVTKLGENVRINQYELSEVVSSRIEEILNFARSEINTLTKRPVDYIIITGGTSSMEGFNFLAKEVLGNTTSVGSIKILGVRNNKYSSAIGNIIYFINKLRLKNVDYTMFDDEFEISNKNNIMNVINDTVLGKVFGYFFE